MVLIIDNQKINNIEELIKSIRERHEDYGFIKKLNDLFVDGDLEDFIKTCQNSDVNRYIDLLSNIDKSTQSDRELFQQIANVFNLSIEPIVPDFSHCFEFVGVQWDDGSNTFDSSEVFWLDTKPEKEHTIKVGLRIKSSVMESIELSLQIKDIHNEIVKTYLSEPTTLNNNENSITGVKFKIKPDDFTQFRTVDIVYRNKTLHSIRCYPSTISIKVKDVIWFSMNNHGGKYECRIPFLLWFVMMPKTTNRDARYSFDDVKIEDILYTSGINYGSELHERVKMVEQCINRLRNHTGLNIQLKTDDDRPAAIAKWVGGKFYFDPNDASSSIYIYLSVEDYINAMKENNDCFVFPWSKIGMMVGDSIVTNPKEIVQLMSIFGDNIVTNPKEIVQLMSILRSAMK